MTAFSFDFLLGQTDCREGIPHEAGKSEAYDRGYSAEYTHQENISALAGRVA